MAHRFFSKALKNAWCACIDKSSINTTLKSILTSSVNTTLKSLLKRGYHGSSETFSFTFSYLSDFRKKCWLQHSDWQFFFASQKILELTVNLTELT